MALAVLDASVAIAVLAGPADTLHTAAVAALDDRRGDELRLPASAYAEYLVHPLRAGDPVAESAKTALADLGIRVEPLSAEIAEAAARLRAGHPALRLPDALVLATGEVVGAQLVLTGDERWRKVPLGGTSILTIAPGP